MPRRSDPAVGILRFFREAELPTALLLLGLVKAEVAARVPTKVKRVRKPQPTPEPGGVAGPVGSPTPPRRRNVKEADVPLPGLQSTVGG